MIKRRTKVIIKFLLGYLKTNIKYIPSHSFGNNSLIPLFNLAEVLKCVAPTSDAYLLIIIITVNIYYIQI